MKSLLPKVSREVADRHSAELYSALRNNTIMDLFLRLGKEVARESPLFASYMGFLSKSVAQQKKRDNIVKLSSYQGGFTDILYLLREVSPSLLPKFQQRELLSPDEILEGGNDIFHNSEFRRIVEEENPNLLYYYNKRFEEDLKSDNAPKRLGALFFGEGFLDGYRLLR
ncbi:MAG: hypothetical protein AABX83_02190 [Nanoarchaeota archaeon]